MSHNENNPDCDWNKPSRDYRGTKCSCLGIGTVNREYTDCFYNGQEWCTLQELKDYGINFVGDGWYKRPEEEWAYISKEGDEYLLSVWDYDPRLHFAKIAGAEVHE